MKSIFIILMFSLTACAAPVNSQPSEGIMPAFNASYPDLGPAPELSNTTWLNADSPLRLADLRGKVVAIDMWTFG
jgi:hypothetical protein